MSSSADLTGPPRGPWAAPMAPAPVRATVTVPGSKSETNRALVLAALADGPSTITNGLDARDTRLMRDGLRTLGVGIDDSGEVWRITPPTTFTGGGTVDCGLAGTVMRFLPPLAAVSDGQVTFDGDEQAYARPMGPLLEGLTALGAQVSGTRLPFTVTGRSDLAGGSATIDASSSSQYVSGLLLIGARLTRGLDLRHAGGDLPSRPHIAMTVAMLRHRGVQVDDSRADRWVISPGPIAARDVIVEPDLSNAAPFLAAAAITGGEVAVPHWPAESNQPGRQVPQILRQFGADITYSDDGSLVVSGTDEIDSIEIDLRDASELTPVVAALAALAADTSHIRGVAHIRGHETDRLAALAAELEGLGTKVRVHHDGLSIHPRLMGGGTWHTYADHRMAQAGALLGLVVEDVVVDDVACTDKTLPEFVALWDRMLADSVAESDAEIAADPRSEPV
ncbi:MAG TPA: 3-phosphoshikimate 1-carboxyvinyltransferase [Microlunatus sp.]|nr:3-phosphoshikimate 1-carboxyvinyltransferase [Microlunatus sp.]